MRVAIIDYGMGNLGSVTGALTALGVACFIAHDPEQINGADRLVLPGVGSFGDGMTHLAQHGWVDAIRENVLHGGKPLLGICLGMQLLASRGTEFGDWEGLDLIPGTVRRLDLLGSTERIPHVGWNSIRLRSTTNALFEGLPTGTDFYFVHSFAFQAAEPGDVLAEVDYGVPFSAAIARGAIFGTQFHPEKSSKAGARLLRNFLSLPIC